MSMAPLCLIMVIVGEVDRLRMLQCMSRIYLE